MFICTCQLVFWAHWHFVKMRCLRKSWSALEACRVFKVEGRDSHFLSGPNLKKGQIQSNINHFKLRSFRSTIVIEQTSGKRPVAGGNKKPFDNHKVRFFPRSAQHLHKPKRAMSGCQHQAGHIYTPIFSQRDSRIHWYMNTCISGIGSCKKHAKTTMMQPLTAQKSRHRARRMDGFTLLFFSSPNEYVSGALSLNKHC